MKIGFCGTQSVGKSTLVQTLSKLSEFKDYTIFTERSKEIMSQGIPLNTDSTLIGQTYFMGHRAIELKSENMITDRTILDVISFTNNAQSITNEDKLLFEQYASRFISEYDWIFYVSPAGTIIEDNKIRTTDPIYRNLIDNSIKQLLSFHLDKIKNIAIISGSTDDRIKQVLNYIF